MREDNHGHEREPGGVLRRRDAAHAQVWRALPGRLPWIGAPLLAGRRARGDARGGEAVAKSAEAAEERANRLQVELLEARKAAKESDERARLAERRADALQERLTRAQAEISLCKQQANSAGSERARTAAAAMAMVAQAAAVRRSMPLSEKGGNLLSPDEWSGHSGGAPAEAWAEIPKPPQQQPTTSSGGDAENDPSIARKLFAPSAPSIKRRDVPSWRAPMASGAAPVRSGAATSRPSTAVPRWR